MINIRIDSVDFLKKQVTVSLILESNGRVLESRTVSNPNVSVPASWQNAAENYFQNNIKPALISHFENKWNDAYIKLSELDPDTYPPQS